MVCFQLNEISTEQSPKNTEVRQVTKNTFVHFQHVDLRSRRQTAHAGLASLRRLTWDEEDISEKMRAPAVRTFVRQRTWDAEEIGVVAPAARRPFVRDEIRSHTCAPV